MNNKKLIVGIITILAISTFGAVIARAVYYAPPGEVPLPNQTGTPSDVSTSDPVRLVIPKININAKVQHVGITFKGNMATPNNFTDVGWYKYGVIPGQIGSAVIAGHVDDGLALPAVFANLQDLQVGDEIYVTTESNTTLHFVVTGSATYPFDAPTSQIFSENDGRLLKLITCAGTWNEQYKTHDKRLVVTAMLE